MNHHDSRLGFGRMIRNLVAFVGFASSEPSIGQDEKVLKALVTAYCDAWNNHDGHALASIMAEDVDYVNVGARWFQGKSDVETYHTRLLSGRFGHSRMDALEIKIRAVRHDLAVVRWMWRIAEDKNVDGSARPKRFGLLTMLAEKHDDEWEVIVVQNTNLIPGAVPEEEGISSPVHIPDESEM